MKKTLDDLRTQNDNLEVKITNLSEKNEQEAKKIKDNELEKTKKEAESLRHNFESERDQLENKYHVIFFNNRESLRKTFSVKENIKRKFHKREMFTMSPNRMTLCL